MFPIKTLQKMIEIVRANMKPTITEDKLFYSLSHIEKLMKEDIEKANRWLGYYQKVGEERGLWTLSDVIKWVREENVPKTMKCFIYSICGYGIVETNDTFIIKASSICEILYLVESYQLKYNGTVNNVIITFCQEIPESDYYKYLDIFRGLPITLEEAEQIRNTNRNTQK